RREKRRLVHKPPWPQAAAPGISGRACAGRQPIGAPPRDRFPRVQFQGRLREVRPGRAPGWEFRPLRRAGGSISPRLEAALARDAARRALAVPRVQPWQPKGRRLPLRQIPREGGGAPPAYKWRREAQALGWAAKGVQARLVSPRVLRARNRA